MLVSDPESGSPSPLREELRSRLPTRPGPLPALARSTGPASSFSHRLGQEAREEGPVSDPTAPVLGRRHPGRFLVTIVPYQVK